MQRVTCAQKIAAYLKENQISAEQTAQDTGVSLEKLNATGQENLTAAEFLEVCWYLNIKPEEMR